MNICKSKVKGTSMYRLLFWEVPTSRSTIHHWAKNIQLLQTYTYSMVIKCKVCFNVNDLGCKRGASSEIRLLDWMRMFLAKAWDEVFQDYPTKLRQGLIAGQGIFLIQRQSHWIYKLVMPKAGPKAHSIESFMPSTSNRVLFCAFVPEVINLFMCSYCRLSLGLGVLHMEHLVLVSCLVPAVHQCWAVDVIVWQPLLTLLLVW